MPDHDPSANEDRTRTRAGGPVDLAAVTLAADELLRDGERPTIDRIRRRLGRGSPNTINPLLDTWWKSLARRLEGGPQMLERIPQSAFHVLEALWIRLSIEARERADQLVSKESEQLAATARQVELKSDVLTLREGEYQERLRQREQSLREAVAAIKARDEELTALRRDLRAAERRNLYLSQELDASRLQFVGLLARAVEKDRKPRTPNVTKKAKSPKRRAAKKK